MRKKKPNLTILLDKLIQMNTFTPRGWNPREITVSLFLF